VRHWANYRPVLSWREEQKNYGARN